MSDLQLNFVIDDSPRINVTQVTQNLKKGSWKKKRMDAKRIVQRVKKQNNTLLNKMKPTESIANSVEKEMKPTQEPFQRHKTNVQQREIPKQGFSSSIFTANPEFTKREEKQEKDTVVEDTVFSNSTFPGLGIHPVLSTHLEKSNITIPTTVQRLSIPKLNNMLDNDVIIQAQTGSGKTLSFLLPVLNHLIRTAAENEKSYEKDFFSRSTGAFAIVLVPTRELAQQIAQVLESLLRYTRVPDTEENTQYCRHWIVSGILVGGESKKSEKARLRKGINILVCTPGRLLDHLKTTESFQVGNLRWLVLDEADNLLHLGFEETLRDILVLLNEKGNAAVHSGIRQKVPRLPFQRQTILCSATIEGGVEKLAQESLRNPVFVKVECSDKPVNDSVAAESTDIIQIPKQLKQLYVMSPAKLRLVNLIGLLRKITESGKKNCKIIVFVATGDSVDWHFDSLARCSESPDRDNAKELKLSAGDDSELPIYNDLVKLKEGYSSQILPNSKIYKLHGSLQQAERHSIFSGFSPELKGSSSILICTDVAARGLDVPDVTHIIQYDPPADIRDYIHRIGRTARIGKEGSAYVFLLPSEIEYLDLLEDYQCRLKEQQMPELLETLVPLTTSKQKKQKHKSYEVAATDLHMSLERFVHSTQSNLLFAQKAFSSHIRAYTTHIASEKHIFHIRKLHLGHMAKSFCLREAPQVLQSKVGQLNKDKESKSSTGGVSAGTMKRKAIQMAKDAMMSEFADGDVVQTIKKSKNRQ